jgi:glutamine cyclotransferase
LRGEFVSVLTVILRSGIRLARGERRRLKETGMRIERIRDSENLARKFARDSAAFVEATKAEGGKYLVITGSKQSGALRRLSLELTRALAEMRKP